MTEERKGKSTNKGVGEFKRDLEAHELEMREKNPELYKKIDAWEARLNGELPLDLKEGKKFK
ncbi:MAG TPA: hypothetical protein VJH63_03225 [Candidatus Paceibacterota bacterium]